MKFSNFTSIPAHTVFSLLDSSESGLSEKEVARHRAKYGKNEMELRRVTMVDIFFKQFKTPFFYLLISAAVVSILIGEGIDGLVILAFVAINVTLGFVQEAKALRTVALLKRFSPEKVRVIRNQKESVVDRVDLVLGDVVILEAGNIVPADVRVFRSENLVVDESLLTGESISVNKSSKPLAESAKDVFSATNILFSGTAILEGEAMGVVVLNGRDTALGEIADLANQSEPVSMYENDLLTFSRLMVRIVVASITVVFVIGFFLKGGFQLINFSLFCVALIVGIIPEALPLIVTVSFSKGARRLALNKVVVKRLSAIEDLGNIEILCTDKTGTLTENKLVLESIQGRDQDKCLLFSLFTSSIMKETIETTENSFDRALRSRASSRLENRARSFSIIDKIPFSNERLLSSALVSDQNGRKFLAVKGAPEAVLDRSVKIDGSLSRREVERQIKAIGRSGRRVLGVAYRPLQRAHYKKEDESKLVFLGLLEFEDPIKPSAKETIHLASRLGVEIKIITGDSKEVAGAVAHSVGIIDQPGTVISEQELKVLTKRDFTLACKKHNVFARISPEMKHRIIQTLQKRSEVGFLGEGINDVPALRAANVGIAVREGTDMSRDTADIVLLKKDLRVIVQGIREGRNIFANINKYLKTTIASNFGNMYSLAIISLFIPYLPMLPVQILLVNLLSDFPLITIASDRVDIEELRKPKSYLLRWFMPLIIGLAVISSTFDLVFFGIFHRIAEGQLQTLWFVESILTEIVLIFSLRTRHVFLFGKKPSKLLVWSALGSLVATVALPFTAWGQAIFRFNAVPMNAVVIVLSLVLAYFGVSELFKLWFYHRLSVAQLVKKKRKVVATAV